MTHSTTTPSLEGAAVTSAVERVRSEMALVRDCTVCDGDGTVQRHDPPYGQRQCGGCQGTGTRPVMGNNALRDALTTILSDHARLSAALGEAMEEIATLRKDDDRPRR